MKRKILLILTSMGLYFCVPLESPEKVGGTSSGVDNPELVVTFRDDSGEPISVSGEYGAYASTHNPWKDSRPLFDTTLHQVNRLVLTPEMFFPVKNKSFKKSAGKPSSQSSSRSISINSFNLVFVSDSSQGEKTGSVQKGFSLDDEGFYRNEVKILNTEMSVQPFSVAINSKGPHSESVLYYAMGTPFKSYHKNGISMISIPEGFTPVINTIPSHSPKMLSLQLKVDSVLEKMHESAYEKYRNRSVDYSIDTFIVSGIPKGKSILLRNQSTRRVEILTDRVIAVSPSFEDPNFKTIRPKIIRHDDYVEFEIFRGAVFELLLPWVESDNEGNPEKVFTMQLLLIKSR